jgi:hypothetical protein
MIKNLILSLDFLGPEPKLKVFSHDRYKTIFGGFLSMSAAITILVLAIYFCITTFERSQLSVIKNEVPQTSPEYKFFEKTPLAFVFLFLF